MMPPECCTFWNGNPLIAATRRVVARADGFPVTPGHALVIPRRHVDRFADLTVTELLEAHDLIERVCRDVDADDFTIAVNDGPAAGRTVPHLHIHVIPRRPGDVQDPRGGVRQVLLDGRPDPWVAALNETDGAR